MMKGIVQVDEEIQGELFAKVRKRADEDALLAKTYQAAACKTDELSARASWILYRNKEVEEDHNLAKRRTTILPNLSNHAGSKEEVEATAMCDAEVNRLRMLLVDDPKKLSEKDVEDVMRCLEVDEIISLAMKSGQGYRSDGDENGRVDGDVVEIVNALKVMLYDVEKVKEEEVCMLYKNISPRLFSDLLLTAVDVYKGSNGFEPIKEEVDDIIHELCRCVLPWKLLAHILYHKVGLPHMIYKEPDVVYPFQGKPLAQTCHICMCEISGTVLLIPANGPAFPTFPKVYCASCKP